MRARRPSRRAAGRCGRLLLGGALLALAAAPAAAQDIDFEQVEIRSEAVAPGLAVLFGAGGNIAVSTGADGPVLVDDQYAPLVPRILAAVKALQDAPVRFVINTHWHGDHTGGNEAIGKAGALIVAHENVRRRMSTKQFMAAFQREIPPSPAVALPVVTFDDGVTLHWNGEEIAVEHVDPAHTDGDALVWFRKANVVHTGDTYVAGMLPFVDVSSGGTLAGFIESAERVLAQAGPETKIVPGHGPLSNAAELGEWREMLIAVQQRVQGALADGKSLEAFQAEQPLADFAPRYGKGFLNAERFLAIVWSDLSRPKEE
jgi:glyoxylase-like metal-dependent hydrolase (beta-lactamase superfamily II)